MPLYVNDTQIKNINNNNNKNERGSVLVLFFRFKTMTPVNTAPILVSGQGMGTVSS